jgi:hypothetical protein
MNCERFQQALLEDEPVDRGEMQRHAADCPGCADALEERRELERSVEAWKAAAPAPAPELEARIAAAIEREQEAARVVPLVAARERRTRRGARAWTRVAAAAVLLIGAAALFPYLYGLAGRTPLERALRQAEASQTEYAEAIARLELEARPVLQRAGDPELPAEQAAVLLAYRDRLAHLDAVIDEVQGYLNENPGHAGGHTVLLAAYREKDEVLQEVIRLRNGETS